MIDVRELMATLTDAELLQAADDYFKGLTVDSEQWDGPDATLRPDFVAVLAPSADSQRA